MKQNKFLKLFQSFIGKHVSFNRSSIIILLIILIPTMILIFATFLALLRLQNKIKTMIDEFAEQLYKDQIHNSLIQNTALVFQLSQQIQRISWEMNLQSEYFQGVLNEDVIYNADYIPTYHNIDRSYQDDENPQILDLYRRNELLTSSWHQVNKTKVEELDDLQKMQLYKAIRTDHLVRAIKYQSINSKSRQFKINDIYMAHQYDGMVYTTSMNRTYETFKPPPNCIYFGKYKLDLRCRYYYEPTTKNISIMLFDPQTFFSKGNTFLASVFCKRIQKYENKNPDSPNSVYSILCLSFDLSVIPQYFSNFGSSSKYQMVLDPRKLTVVYHSQFSQDINKVVNIQELETKNLQDQRQATIFLDNINSFNKYILESKNKLLNTGARTDITRKQFEYNRNGTECFVTINLITMIDKVPRYEYLKTVNSSSRYQIKGSFLFLDILSKEVMTKYSQDIKQKIKIYNQYFSYASIILTILMLGFQTYYSFLLGKNIMHPVIHLTRLLTSIHFFQKNSLDVSNEVNSDQQGDKMTQSYTGVAKSEMYTEQNWNIQFDENFDNTDFDDVCFSSDTQVLLNSFQNLFKILRFTTQNFYNENESISMLNLNIQIQHFGQFGNNRALGVCHNNIGVIHYNNGRFNEAINSFEKALIYAKYELNMYSNEDLGSFSQVNCIKNNSVHMRSTFMQKTNSLVDLSIQKQATVSNSEKYKNSSNFENRDGQYFTAQTQANSERELLNWNLYNRNQNYIKALAQYIFSVDKESSNMWDLVQDISIENATISQLYLPLSTKREMLDCYIILKSLFMQNFYDETSNLLNRFSNLYIKNFEEKNTVPLLFYNKSNSHDINNNQIDLQLNNEKQNHEITHDPKLQDSQLINQMNNSKFILSPLNTAIKINKQEQNRCQNYSQQNLILNQSNQNLQKQKTLTNQQSLLKKYINSSQSQSQFEQIQQKFQKNEMEDIIENQNTPSGNISIISSYQDSLHHLNKIQSQNLYKNRNKYDQNYEKQEFQQSSNIKNIFLSSEILEGKLNPSVLGSQKHVQNINAPLQPQILKLTNELNGQPSNLNIFQQNLQDYHTLNKKNNYKNFKQLISKFKHSHQSSKNIMNNSFSKNILNSSKIKVLSQNKKTKTKTIDAQISKNTIQNKKTKKRRYYYKVRKIEQSEKLAQYEYSSDIYFQYYALQQAQFQLNSQNYLNASLILTNVLEQCKYYLPHLKMKIISKLGSIFSSQKLYSPELNEMENNYQNIQNLNSSIYVISSCLDLNSEIKIFKLCSDIINEILFKNNDCFGLIKYCFQEGIYLQQIGETNKKTIKSSIKFFENIIFPNCIKNIFFFKTLYEKQKKQQGQLADQKFIFQTIHVSQNSQVNSQLCKSCIEEQKQQSNQQSDCKLHTLKGKNSKQLMSKGLTECIQEEEKELNLKSFSSSFNQEIFSNEEINFNKQNQDQNLSKNDESNLNYVKQVIQQQPESILDCEFPPQNFNKK